jgi:phosphoenolpyruvate carboxylase
MENNRAELRAKLRSKISESKITRSSKKQKEQILDTTLGKMNINKDKLFKDMEALAKQGKNKIYSRFSCTNS